MPKTQSPGSERFFPSKARDGEVRSEAFKCSKRGRRHLLDSKAGESGVGIGIYATALWPIGRDNRLAELAAPAPTGEPRKWMCEKPVSLERLARGCLPNLG